MVVCEYSAASPSGICFTKRPPPITVSSPRPGLLGTALFASTGSLVVRVKACGVNPVDAKYIIGDKFPVSWMEWCARRVSGHTPGFDFSGEVVRCPPECGFKVGDEVFGLADDPACIARGRFLMGSLGEYISPPLNQVTLKPPGLSHAKAAALPLVGVTAIQVFSEHGLMEGQRVLVIGASGGVGHVATQVASLKGAMVIGICSKLNRNFVLECGASVVLTYNDEGGDIIEKIEAEALENGKFHIVLDCVNSADSRDSKPGYRERLLQISDQILKNPDLHNYVVLGGTTLQWIKAAIKRFISVNLFSKSFELFWIKMPNCTPYLNLLKELVERPEGECQLVPKIDQELEWTEESVCMAFEALRSRRTAGKIVLRM